MACRIPGCDTRYWDKNNKLQMFAADGKQTLLKWHGILKTKYGTENFGSNDRICILHFAENALERTRKVYLKGGLCQEIELNKPKLCAGALPTIFPNKIPRKKEKYYVKVSQEILDKQRKIFEESRRNKEISLKRKLESDSVLEEEIPAKEMKRNNLFNTIVNNINNRKKSPQTMKKPWIQTLNADECVVWSLWKENRSCIEKNIFLDPDLKVEVFIESKQVILPEAKDIVDMNDLEKLFEKIERIIPCKKLNGSVSPNDCLGFVVPSLNGKRMRCLPCCKLQKKSKRRSSTQSKAKEKCSIKRKTLRLQCKLLSSKERRLKMKKIIEHEANHIRKKRKLSKLTPDADTERKVNSKKTKKSDSTECQEISEKCKTNIEIALKPIRKRNKKRTNTLAEKVVQKQKKSCTTTTITYSRQALLNISNIRNVKM